MPAAPVRAPDPTAPAADLAVTVDVCRISDVQDRVWVRVANEGVWDASFGENVLGTITIDDAAPGTSDPSASTLRLLD